MPALWHLPGVFSRRSLERAADVVRRRGPDAILSDALWRLFGDLRDAPPLLELTRPRDLVPLDAAWAWCTHPGATGWPLHRDDPRHGDHLTAWVALVDVGPRNGAIRWSPYDCDRAELAVSSLEVAPFAQAGDVLVWDHATWHCGGRVLPGELPRVCAALEFGRPPDRRVLDVDRMLLEPDAREAALLSYRMQYAHLVRAARVLEAR